MANNYFHSSKFTLVPEEITSAEQQRKIMSELFDVADAEQLRSLQLSKYHALLLYSANYLNENGEPSIAEETSLPVIFKYINSLDEITAYNKAILDYSKDYKTSYIAIGQGDKLIMANSFATSGATSALYFLLEALRQKQINPKQTSVQIYGELSEQELTIFKSYLMEVRQLQ